MLTTPLIGAVQAGFGGKNKANFEWYVVQWPLGREITPEDTRQHYTKKGDWMVKNVHTYGVPPLWEVEWMPTPFGNLVTNYMWGDYPRGGIRLTIDDGTNNYVLLGIWEKTEMVFISYNKTDPEKRGIIEVSKWSFTITDVDEVIAGEAPEDAVGSTMYGTLPAARGVEDKIMSTKGTGMFEGAFLRGTQNTFAGGVLNPSPPPVAVLLAWVEASGEIVFP